MSSGTSLKQLDCGGDSHLVGATSTNVGQCLTRRRTLGFAGTGSVSWQRIHPTLKFKHITCSPEACWAVTTGHRILCSKVRHSSAREISLLVVLVLLLVHMNHTHSLILTMTPFMLFITARETEYLPILCLEIRDWEFGEY